MKIFYDPRVALIEDDRSLLDEGKLLISYNQDNVETMKIVEEAKRQLEELFNTKVSTQLTPNLLEGIYVLYVPNVPTKEYKEMEEEWQKQGKVV